MGEANGHVSDWQAAMRIAYEAWQARYGIDVKAHVMRCVVKRRNDSWIVEASPSPIEITVTPKREGKRIASERRSIHPEPIGTFIAEIASVDGRVLSIARTT